MKRLFALILLVHASVVAAESGFWTATSKAPMDAVYDAVYKGLEADNFYVVFEADMGSRMGNFQERWGDNYNRNGLGAIKSMVFCNIWWTNQVANAHPDLLGLCPLSVSLYERDGVTTVVLPRPSVLAADSPAGEPGREVAAELEQELTTIVTKALKGLQ